MKKIISLLIAVLMLCTLSISAFAEENAPTAYNAVGDGTSENPWQISTLAQLENLADVVKGGNSMEGKYIVLTVDVEGFTKTIGYKDGSMSYYDKPFKGHFDGKGHTVTLNINMSGAYYVGLFGYIGSGSAVCNLNTAGSVKGKSSTGSICGVNYGTIYNCSNSATVEGNSSIGGICGENCGTIFNCCNTGNITVEYGVGGICYSNKSGATMSNCYNCGKIVAEDQDYTGGICCASSGKISNCYYNKTEIKDNGKGTGLPTAQMKAAAGTKPYLVYLHEMQEDDWTEINGAKKPLVDLLNDYLVENPTADAYVWDVTEGEYPHLVSIEANEEEEQAQEQSGLTEGDNLNTGSAISEGNLTLIVGIAAAVVFGLGGFFLGTKKKKPATANGASVENKDDEE